MTLPRNPPLWRTLAAAFFFSVTATAAWSQTATDLTCVRCVDTSDLNFGSVSTTRLGTGAVTTVKLGNGAVTTVKIAPQAVQTGQIAVGAVNATRIAPLAVNNGKIANQAVTNAKIAPQAVGTGQIALGAINGTRLAPNAVTGNKILNGSVTGGDIANGSITGQDIAPLSLSGINFADGAIGAAKLGLANIVYVEDTGTDAGNCWSLRDSLIGLFGPALVVLGPGTYDCGATPINLLPGVSLAGSGQGVTVIQGNFDSQGGLVALVNAGSEGVPVEIRDISVTNTGGNGTTAMFLSGNAAAAIRLTNVTVTSPDSDSGAVLILVEGGEVNLTNIDILSDGAAIGIYGSFDPPDDPIPDPAVPAGLATLNNVVVRGASTFPVVGLHASLETLTVRNSTVLAAVPIENVNDDTSITIAHSQLAGDVVSGAMSCFGAYDENFQALEADCNPPPP